MSSKLFHTVVAFGITLGAAACSAEAVDEPNTSEAAVISSDTDHTADTAKTEPAPAADHDRFCEVAWPTTKGGPRPDFSCVDPQSQCGDYPGASFGWFGAADTCYELNADSTCNSEKEVWMFCKDTGTSHEFTCPSGMKKSSECTWPAPDDSGAATTEKPARPGAYGG